MTVIDRLRRRISVTDNGCWEWVGVKHRDGYGVIWFQQAFRRWYRLAHVVAYEVWVGPIAEGLELDHLCRNRSCVNPAHLEPVTHRENMRRSISPPGKWQMRTHCERGHEFSGANLIIRGDGARQCRTCKRERGRLAAQQKRMMNSAAMNAYHREWRARRKRQVAD
jgi:hypothetical protein